MPAVISGYGGWGVRGCCVLWCVDLTPCHKIPHSESECGTTTGSLRWHTSGARASLQEKMGRKPQSRDGSGGSRQRMMWRSKGTGRMQRSGAQWSIHRLLPLPSRAAKDVSVKLPNWTAARRHCLLCGGKKQVFEVRTYEENRCHMCSSKYVNFPILFWISQWIITVSESSNTSAIVATYGRDVCGNFVYQPKKVWV